MPHTLLLADDSITIQRVMELTFSGEAVRVITVGDGEAAIECLTQDPPDIVVADIEMPRRTGYEVAAFVKGRPDLSHIPVLLLAGAFEPVDDGRAREVRCDGVLVKPFNPQHLIARVRELLERRPPPRLTAVSADGPTGATVTPPAAARWSGAASQGHPGGPPDPEGTQDALGEYFDQLSDAIAARRAGARADAAARAEGGGAMGIPAVGVDAEAGAPLPTLESVIGATEHGGEAANGSRLVATRHDAIAPTPGGTSLASAFGALLAAEAGDPHRGAVAAGALHGDVSDELVERVATQVVERLASARARAVLDPVIAEVAQRVVREEFARRRPAPDAADR